MVAGAAATVGILKTWEPCRVDDVRCVLNPSQRCDLEDILQKTPAARRLRVAMAFVGVETMVDLIRLAGLEPSDGRHDRGMDMRANFTRWTTGAIRMPMGIGFRLARVFGVPPDLLCEGYI